MRQGLFIISSKHYIISVEYGTPNVEVESTIVCFKFDKEYDMTLRSAVHELMSRRTIE